MPNKNHIALYRCMFDDYDFILSELFIMPNVDYYLFTDNDALDIYPYQKIIVKQDKDNPSISNRAIKMKLPDVLRSYALTIYIDSNVGIMGDLNPLISQFVQDGAAIGSFSHPSHHSLEQEIELCRVLEKGDVNAMEKERQFYLTEPFPIRDRLSDNSVIFRKRYDNNMIAAMDFWFELTKKYSGRDQLSLPAVKGRFNIDDFFFDFSPRTRFNKYFIVFPHKLNRKKVSLKKLVKFYLSFFLRFFFRYLFFIKGAIRNL
ncbi:MAG: hypothetical protein ACJA0H_002058 [Francisellaceae bacterium]|jgi:hypothetical protein